MRFAEWESAFRPMESGARGEGVERYLFDRTRAATLDAFNCEQPLRVWTLVDTDGDPAHQLIVEGLRIVNRVGHLVTEVPAGQGEAYEVALTDAEEW